MLVSNSPSGTLDWNSSIIHLYPTTPWIIICIIFWLRVATVTHVLLGEAQMKCCLLALETTNCISCTTRCFLHHLGQSLADKIILDAINSLHTSKMFKWLVIQMISDPDCAPVAWDATPGMGLRWREGVKLHCPCPGSAVLKLNEGVEAGAQLPAPFSMVVHELVCGGTWCVPFPACPAFRWGLAPGEEAQREF